MLRGPQRPPSCANTEQLHRFADVSSVEGFLDELAGRRQAMVVRLPRPRRA